MSRSKKISSSSAHSRDQLRLRGSSAAQSAYTEDDFASPADELGTDRTNASSVSKFQRLHNSKLGTYFKTLIFYVTGVLAIFSLGLLAGFEAAHSFDAVTSDGICLSLIILKVIE